MSRSDTHIVYAIIYQRHDLVSCFCEADLNPKSGCHTAAAIIYQAYKIRGELYHVFSFYDVQVETLPLLAKYYLIAQAIKDNNFQLSSSMLLLSQFSLSVVVKNCSDLLICLFIDGNLDAIRYLVSYHVDILSLKFNGESAIEVAKMHDQDETVAYLQKLAVSCLQYQPSISFFAPKRHTAQHNNQLVSLTYK